MQSTPITEVSMTIRWLIALILIAGCKTPGEPSESAVKAEGLGSDRQAFLRGKQMFRCEAEPGKKFEWIEIAQFDTPEYSNPVGNGSIKYWTNNTLETNGDYATSQGTCDVRPYDKDESDQRT